MLIDNELLSKLPLSIKDSKLLFNKFAFPTIVFNSPFTNSALEIVLLRLILAVSASPMAILILLIMVSESDTALLRSVIFASAFEIPEYSVELMFSASEIACNKSFFCRYCFICNISYIFNITRYIFYYCQCIF